MYLQTLQTHICIYSIYNIIFKSNYILYQQTVDPQVQCFHFFYKKRSFVKEVNLVFKISLFGLVGLKGIQGMGPNTSHTRLQAVSLK
jgi:hypothetical protein